MLEYNIKKEIILRIIKVIDIAYIFSFYAASGFFLSLLLDKLFPQFDEAYYKNKKPGKILANILLHFSIIGIIVYLTKNLFELIPFPLNGIYGYEHKKLKELKEALPLVYTIIYFQHSLRSKLLFVKNQYIL